jgi:uncharacterized protein (DUF4415 family)
MKKKSAFANRDNDAIDDPDSPELTPELIRRMRPIQEFPEWPGIQEAVEELRAKKRGRPKLEHPKVQVTLRLDADVVGAFKEDGPGWQGRINEELKKTVKRKHRRSQPPATPEPRS